MLWRPDHDEPRRGEIMRKDGAQWIVRLTAPNGYSHTRPCFEADLEKVEVKP